MTEVCRSLDIATDSYVKGYAAGQREERERLRSLADRLDRRVKVVREVARLGSIHVAGIREHWAMELQEIAATIRAGEESQE